MNNYEFHKSNKRNLHRGNSLEIEIEFSQYDEGITA